MKNLTTIFKREIADLYPAYFAMVMSTGIISIGAHFMEYEWISKVLLYLNSLFFVGLILFLTIRILFFFAHFVLDFSNHRKSAGFLTLIAGTCVLGTQFVLVDQNLDIARILYFLGFFLWVFLLYFFFVMITIRNNKPSIEQGLDGTWLLMVVATQSLSILGILVQNTIPVPKELFLFFNLTLFLLGCLLYIIIITLIFYRLAFFKLPPRDFAPPYWINMGAVAITTLAGSVLLSAGGKWDFLESLSPFITGFTLMFWSIGTWWIPLIILLGFWRHGIKKVPLEYHPQYWGMVFPLGMYAACTYIMDKVMNLNFLYPLAHSFLLIAVLVWTICVFGWVRRLYLIYWK